MEDMEETEEIDLNSRSARRRRRPQPSRNQIAPNRQRLAKLLQLRGYSACREALILLEDHFNSSSKYEKIEDFISDLNRVITFQTDAGSSIIDPDLAYQAIKILCNDDQRAPGADNSSNDNENNLIQLDDQNTEATREFTIRVRNVDCGENQPQADKNLICRASGNEKLANEFDIHYNFLYKRLNSLKIFKENFQLMKLATLTGSTQPSIRCICFGLLIKDITKIDGYMLVDNTGRVPIRLTPDTTFRNRLAYTNCIVLVEGVYINPDDVLFAANIGLPPTLLDPITDKSLACHSEKMVIILKELYMDDDDICKSVDILFTGYNSMEEPPVVFILIGDFTRYPYRPIEYRKYSKRLIRIIRTCDNLKESHFVFVPGQRDTNYLVDGEFKDNYSMPKPPLTKEQMPIDLLNLSGFEKVHLTTNPTHIHLNDRKISVVSHSYLKELKKNLIHDLSDHNEEFFETAKQIILSNAHLVAGISKVFYSSMNLWHKPDLLILADTEAFGNKYDYSSSKQDDTSFATVPSFSRQFNQFKVYYLKTGEIEDSQVSSDVLAEIEDDSDDGEEEQTVKTDQDQDRSEMDQHLEE